MKSDLLPISIWLLLLPTNALSQPMPSHEMMTMPHEAPSLFCADPNEATDLFTGMCAPLPKVGIETGRDMIHGNLFLVGISQEGPRGRDQGAAPNMLMIESSRNSGSSHLLGVNLMLTFEKWTFPKEGYPELLQIGEKNQDGAPYIDAQHPHSSPIMGLTLSDTYRWDQNSKDHAKIFFAPRGQSTEGPIAFMHRNTGMVNPDAPLGHHIGQDVGHITSTVLGGSVNMSKFSWEVSAFHGAEPSPASVDLQLGPLDSGATRFGYQFGERTLALASFSYVQNPEPDEAEIKFYRRYSASIYNEWTTDTEWNAYNTFIYGRVENYDLIPSLTSFAEEFAIKKMPMTFWSRLEVLERAPKQLAMTISEPEKPRWINAATLGYTHQFVAFSDIEIQAGISLEKYFLPSEFDEEYSADPWAGKIFIQISGMKMKDHSKMQHP